MKYTTNYRLLQPQQSYFYDIQDHNDNMAILDRELKAESERSKEYVRQTVGNAGLLPNSSLQIWQKGTRFTREQLNGRYALDCIFSYCSEGIIVEKAEQGAQISIPENRPCQLYFRNEIYNTIRKEIVTLSWCIDGKISKKTYRPQDLGSHKLSMLCGMLNLPIGIYTLNWVKLELGTEATKFVPRSYGEELALCQRYYQKGESSSTYVAVAIDERQLLCLFDFHVSMRVKPTIQFFHDGVQGKIWNKSKNTILSLPTNIEVVGDENRMAYIVSPVNVFEKGDYYNFSWTASAEIPK